MKICKTYSVMKYFEVFPRADLVLARHHRFGCRPLTLRRGEQLFIKLKLKLLD